MSGAPRASRKILASLFFGLCLCGISIGIRAAPRDEQWIGSWAAAPQPFMPRSLETFNNQTIRLIVHTSAAGSRVRIILSNAYGDRPMHIGAAHVARRAAGADIVPGSDRSLRFAGQLTVDVPPGTALASDPVALAIPALADLAVSLYFSSPTSATTSHLLALQTSYASPATGDASGAVKFPIGRTLTAWPFLTRVDVVADSPASTCIVAFGDSTVDGDGSTGDSNHRWTDVLAARLHALAGREIGVLNEGIVGNRLLLDSPPEAAADFGAALGSAGIARFERDVLGQPGVRVVIVRLGINDIGFPGALAPTAPAMTATELIAGYRQLIAHAHQKGVRIIGTTLSPFEVAAIEGYYTPAKETVRQEVNAWMRAGGGFDGVADVDLALRDPGHPSRLRPDFDSGDHLHPNDAGYAATAAAIPTALLELSPR